MPGGKHSNPESTNRQTAPVRSLPALLSQVLTGFRVEFDNAFERRMGEAGYSGARLSLVVWTNLMRFIADAPLSVREPAAKSLAPENQIKLELGYLGGAYASRCSLPQGRYSWRGRIFSPILCAGLMRWNFWACCRCC